MNLDKTVYLPKTISLKIVFYQEIQADNVIIMPAWKYFWQEK